nr:unnamed protein product [Spirometra erinaceieuropaei]
MGRALQRRPQPPLHNLRRHHRLSALSGNQRRSRLCDLSPRNHQGRATALQRESARIGRDPCRGLQARWPPNYGKPDGVLPGDVASKRSPATSVYESLFADDYALNATSGGDVQRSMGSSLPPSTTSTWSSTRRRRSSRIIRYLTLLTSRPKST